MKTVIAAALGECAHVAGIMNFLRLAEAAGWRTLFLGPATPIHKVLEAIQQEIAYLPLKEDEDAKGGQRPPEHRTGESERSDILVGVSYRLTPETGERLLGEFAEAADEFRSIGVRFAFGGTPQVAARAKALGFFEQVFEGGEPAELVLAYLKDQPHEALGETAYPQTAVQRITWKTPFPILRHHFGLPTLEATRQGIIQIAEALALDVISLGIDQDAQANFFHLERQDPRRKGAGGVPVRSPDDYRMLYEASRRGNFPLLRTYSGSDDFVRLAEMYMETIQNAWCAIPLFWFNQMDGRGPWDLEGSIREHQTVMEWYGARGVPVELNEPHHWGMRDAPDVIFVATAFLSAYNARACGVQDYIAQLMFNSPPGVSEAMDLARMLAVLDLIEPLSGPNFRIWRQTRTGLLSYPLDLEAARAHLVASIYLQMALRPHIVHVVSYSEAHHAATASEVIESCKLARKAIENALYGQPDMTCDPAIQARRASLVAEAQVTLKAIQDLVGTTRFDPLTDPGILADAVKSGILDAPHLRNNPYAKGQIMTRITHGKCVAVDELGKELSEVERLSLIPGG